MGRPLPSRLLFVADASHAADLASLVRGAVAGGVTFVEVRRSASPALDLPAGARLAEIRAVRAAAPGVTLLVNDRVDLALLADADGAHVGQDDLPIGAARRLLGRRLLGLSTHDARQVEAAGDEDVDYVAIGPIFASRTKFGHAPPIGLAGLRACRRLCRKPLVAIGAVDAENVRAVLDAGADGIAVAGAIARGDAEQNARRLLAVMDGA